MHIPHVLAELPLSIPKMTQANKTYAIAGLSIQGGGEGQQMGSLPNLGRTMGKNFGLVRHSTLPMNFHVGQAIVRSRTNWIHKS